MNLHGATVLGVLFSFLADVKCTEQEDEAARLAVTQSNNAFSTALYQAVSGAPVNIILSPFSAETALALVWIGARGETATELGTALHLPNDRSKVETGFKALLSSLQATQNVTLKLANKLYIQQGSGVKDSYRQAAKDNFYSDAEGVNFENNTESVRVSINNWVEEHTENKIKDLIQEGVLNEQTQLVIVNAIYFKGAWRRGFDKKKTKIEPFYLNSNTSINVSMMHMKNKVPYCVLPELNATAVNIYYISGHNGSIDKKQSMSMVLLLPNDPDGLQTLEDNLGSINVNQILRRGSESARLSVPRFKLEKSVDLKEILKNMNVTKIFQQGADLSGITDENIRVDKVKQKAFIEVTEHGSEAAASTYAVVMYSKPIIRTELKFNRPFLFMIVDNRSGIILFIGRVVDPSQ